MPETAKRTARVPILGANGRISDDYVPAAIGEGVESAEAAAKRAETAATDAAGSATAAGTSATKAQESATAAGSAKTAAETAQKGAESAKTAAEAAKAAAEKAKTDAESASTAASNSASQAATSAESAASSAASVADKYITSAQATTLEPGSQATASVEEQVLTLGIPKGDKGDEGDPGYTPQRGVDYWTAEDVEAIVEDAKTQAVAELAEIGNVPKKTVSDLVAHGEDAYAQKPIETRIKGKTWVNRFPVVSADEYQGMTLSTDETGLISFNGTSTGFSRSFNLNGLASNKQYTMSCSMTIPSTFNIYIGNDSGILYNSSLQGTSSVTFTTGDVQTDNPMLFVVCASGNTVNASFRVMLVDGTEAPDCFTPPASIASVETGNLVTSGKNLLPKLKSTSSAAITSGSVTENEDGSIDIQPDIAISGNADLYYIGDNIDGALIWETGLPRGVPITIKADGYDAAGIGLFVVYTLDNGVTTTTINNASSQYSKTLTIPQNAGVRCFIRINNGVKAGRYTFSVELGSTATSYEPPTVTTTPLPEVELRSLPNGTCDELVIRADGTCEVERKTGSYTATGEENVTFGKGQAYFHPTPTISNLTWRESISCDKLPAVSTTENTLGCSTGYDHRIFFMVPGAITDVETAKQWLATNRPTFVYDLDEHTTEDQADVTLPALPAPTFNQYHDSPVPSDTSVEYARDINIVLSNLEAVQTALLGGE